LTLHFQEREKRMLDSMEKLEEETMLAHDKYSEIEALAHSH
jgi:hypothetical protein